MKAKFILVIALFGIFISCQQKKQNDPPELVKKILFDFYDGIKNKDFERIKEATTADFVLFEDGNIWTLDSIIKTLDSYPPYTAEYSFNNFKVDIENPLGCIRYDCHADFVMSDTLNLKFDWIESATFLKEGDRWKMSFLHSTPKK